MKTIITVILYNKEMDDSETLRQLIHSLCDDCNLLIINNGPKHIKVKDKIYNRLVNSFNDVEVKEYIDNRPLSWIYNDVLKHSVADRYIFLDDDSHLDPLFFDKINGCYNKSIDLQLPLIFETTDKKLYYPLVEKQVFNGQDGDIINARLNILSIGSGLVIYKSIIEKFSSNNLELFDEKFALYGVDFSFFRRMQSVAKNNAINVQIVSFIEHSLSRTSTDYNEWRHRERLYDSALSIRFYSKNAFFSILRLLKLISKEIMSYRINNVFLIIKTFWVGKHPRC
ncbi:glycosyltransferase family 2 protein [Raoultella planticola]|uniref:glycosyltransferase family 2 protein n=1 Tax=Raoultella planticola TaxID=575 RepID=UPI0034E52A2F